MATSILLAACGSLPPLYERHTVQYQEEAATSFVTAYPAIPWAEVKDKFEPNFTMTADAALALVGLPSQALITQGVSASSVGLAVNFAGPPAAASASGSSGSSGTGGTSGSTSSTANTAGTSDAPANGKVPGSVPTAAAATPNFGASDVAPAVTDAIAARLALIDTSLRTDAALGLNQKIQRINSTIGKGYLPKGYRAHVVTLQVGLQPLARNLPYDAYVNISLLPGSLRGDVTKNADFASNASGLPPIVILPVLVIDNIESALVGTTLERIREAGIQLGGGIRSAGARFDAKGGTDVGQSALGYDKNSLMTIGRVNESTVVVRLGAAQGGAAKYAMIPRTHDFSLLVLVRDSVPNLFVTTRTTLRDAITGIALDSHRDREELRKSILESVHRYGYGINGSCDALSGIRGLAPAGSKKALDAAKFDEPLDLVRVLDTGDLGAFSQCIGFSEKRTVQQFEEPRLRRLIAELNTVLVGSPYAKMLIPLKPPVTRDLPSSSTIALAYDSGDAMQVRIAGGSYLASDGVRGTFTVLADKTNVELGSTAITTGETGRDLTLSFPSLQKLGLTAPATGAESVSLVCDDCKTATRAKFRVVYLKADKDEQDTPFSVSSAVLITDANGRGSVSIFVKKLPAGKTLFIAADGADLREVVSGTAIVGVDQGLKLAKQGMAVVQVANATPTREILFGAFDDRDKRSYGKPVRLRVERAAKTTQ